MLVRLLRLPATLPDAAGTASDAAYAYDALGRIRTRTVGVSPSPVTTDAYSYAGASSEAARIATGGVNLDSVVTPSGDRVAALSGSVNWFLPDLHGSVSATLSSDQSTVTSATRYDAYGDAVATGTAGGTAVGATTWKYRGRLDVSPAALGTPLYAMGARLYDPGIGAFTSLDSYSGKAQDPLSMNRFLYAEANPAPLVDPTGHNVGCASSNSDMCDEMMASQHRGTAGGAVAARHAYRKDHKLEWDTGKGIKTARQMHQMDIAAAQAKKALQAAQRKEDQANADLQRAASPYITNKPNAYMTRNPLDNIDVVPQSEGRCLNFGGGLGLQYGQGSICLASDLGGHYAVTFSHGVGADTGGDITLGVGGVVSTAPSVDDWAGTSYSVGGAGGPVPELAGASGGADLGAGSDRNGRTNLSAAFSVQASLQATAGMPVEGHVVVQDTSVFDINPLGWLEHLVSGGG